MRKLFQHIRSQPKDVRNNYAFGFASTFTGIVALIWIITKAGSGVAVPEVAVENNPGAFSTLIKQVKEQAANVGDALKQQTVKNEDNSELDIEAVIASSTALVYASSSESLREATATTSTSTKVAVPVLIGTTSATTTYSASSTP